MNSIFKIILLTCILCHCSSCEFDKNFSCRSGSFKETFGAHDFGNMPFAQMKLPLNENTVYFDYHSNGEVNFRFGKSFDEICPDVPAKVTYELHTTSEPQSSPFGLWAIAKSSLVLQSAFSGSTLFLPFGSSSISPSVILKDSMEVDFKDLFVERPANVAVYMEMGFTSFNSFQEDSLYFVQHIQSILITFEADRF